VYDLLIEDATIVRSGGRRVVDIAIEDGRIAYIGDTPAGRARETVSAIGRFVMPGAIDANVRLSGAEDLASLGRAAAAAGVTSLLLRGFGSRDEIAAVHDAAAAQSVVGLGCWIEGAPTRRSAAEAACEEGLACGIALDMAAHPAGEIAPFFSEGAALLGVQAEDHSTIAAQTAAMAAEAAPAHNDVRPPEAACRAIEQVVSWVRASGRATHLFGVSTSAELGMLDLVRGELPITCEVSLNHLFLSTETVRSLQAASKTNPPIRSELDRRALWSIIKRGRLDTFSSAHTPWSRAEKERPYWEQPAGLPGLDSLMRLLLSAVSSGRVGVEQLAEMCAEAPARICGLPNKGRIEVGADADLVLFREGATARFAASDIHSAAGWSPFVGRELAGPPMLVVVGGNIVAQDGRLRDALPTVSPLSFG